MSSSSGEPRKLVSHMGRSTADRIFVQGHDLCRDLLGKASLSDIAWLEITGKLATPQQSKVLEALLVTLVEHGLTPMAIAARITYLAAPEALQGAVAAGLMGVGSKFAGTAEGAARILQDVAAGPDRDLPVDEMAARIVQDYLTRGQPIPGIGHPVHKPADPRTEVLFGVAKANGYSGRHVQLMEAISVSAGNLTGKILPVNATGAIGAIATELGLDWRICRGLAVIGRCIGLVGHLSEELRAPIAAELWMRAEHETAHNAMEADKNGGQ